MIKKLGKLLLGGVLCSSLVFSAGCENNKNNVQTATTEVKVQTNEKKTDFSDKAKEEQKAQFDSVDDYLYTTTCVNVRVSPSTEADIYKVYQEYTKVHVVGEGQEWCKVEINKKFYYIYKEYLKKMTLTKVGSDFQLTAYCGCYDCSNNYEDVIARPKSCPEGYHKRARTGHTIAVDKRVIPYGSRVYIEGYGVYIAEDCGGAVKNHIIDIFLGNDHAATDRFGRKHNISVYIIKD